MKKLKKISLILLLPLLAGYNLKAQCNFEVSVSKTDVSCYGEADGSAGVEVKGSTGPYTFLWSNDAETTTEVENLEAQTYFVKVTDNNGCEVIEFVTIEEPPRLEVSLETDHVECNGDNSGEIRVQSSGGTGNYQINWSNGSDSEVNSSLYAGDYSVTVTDENYCEASAEVSVTEPSPIELEYEVEHALGHGSSDGSIDISVEGGVSPYEFQWASDDGFADDGEDVHNIPAGTYEVTVTDNNGCQKKKSIEVQEPEALEVDFEVTDVLCYQGADGKIEATVTGGEPPYDYEWANSSIILNQTGTKISGLSADTYSLKVTDANGISLMKRGIEIEEPSQILANITTKPASCYNSEDGELEVSVSGGAGNYSYLWDNDGETTSSIDGLSSGDYSVRIVDKNGCSMTAEATVERPGPIKITHDIKPITCEDQSDGEISVSATGGVSGFEYSWSNGETSPDIDELSEGTYRVTATDANECEVSEEFYIDPGEGNCISIPNAFTPNGDNINDVWVIANSDLYPDMTVKVLSKEGSVVFESNGYDDPWEGRYKGKKLPSGTYYYIIDFKNGDDIYKGTITIVR
ncbi:MAG: gliding motility-associated C-terminal domain-containing protein [Bacteroidota bacterium]